MRHRKLFVIVSFVLFGFSGFSQTAKPLNIYFYEQPVMFFKSDKTNEYSGIEADILKEFIKWCDTKKKIKVTPKYYGYKSFNDYYSAMQSAPANSIGAGTTTINDERKQQFDFSAPYLKNVAVFVSQGSVPTFSTPVVQNAMGTKGNHLEAVKTSNTVGEQFGRLVGLAEKGSVHYLYMQNFISRHSPNTVIQAVNGNPADILASDPKYVAYMDIIAYRELIKNSDKYFKIHRELSMGGESFGFLLPKNSEWLPLINEFMEGGFGFTATRRYREILENYLGYEVISTVELF